VEILIIINPLVNSVADGGWLWLIGKCLDRLPCRVARKFRSVPVAGK
jgi:hypothetical protein